MSRMCIDHMLQNGNVYTTNYSTGSVLTFVHGPHAKVPFSFIEKVRYGSLIFVKYSLYINYRHIKNVNRSIIIMLKFFPFTFRRRFNLEKRVQYADYGDCLKSFKIISNFPSSIFRTHSFWCMDSFVSS